VTEMGEKMTVAMGWVVEAVPGKAAAVAHPSTVQVETEMGVVLVEVVWAWVLKAEV